MCPVENESARDESNLLSLKAAVLRTARIPTFKRADNGPPGNCTPIAGVRGRHSAVELEARTNLLVSVADPAEGRRRTLRLGPVPECSSGESNSDLHGFN